MCSLIRYLVVVLLMLRFAIGVFMVPIILMTMVGLAGMADPTSTNNFFSRVLFFEVPAVLVSAPMAWYVMTRNKDNPKLYGAILVIFGASMIPLWTKALLKDYPAIGWGVSIGIAASGLLVAVCLKPPMHRLPSGLTGRGTQVAGPPVGRKA